MKFKREGSIYMDAPCASLTHKTSSYLPSQKGPEKPLLHLQVKPPSVSMHVPPFLQGYVVQNSLAKKKREVFMQQ